MTNELLYVEIASILKALSKSETMDLLARLAENSLNNFQTTEQPSSQAPALPNFGESDDPGVSFSANDDHHDTHDDTDDDDGLIYATSEIYVPRAPRRPGLPDPPADQWGIFDEYREDADPGFRVREVFEPHHVSSPPLTPSGRSLGLSDDELCSARSGTTPALSDRSDKIPCAFLGVSPSNPQQTSRNTSPSFGLTQDDQNDHIPQVGTSEEDVGKGSSSFMADVSSGASIASKSPVKSVATLKYDPFGHVSNVSLELKGDESIDERTAKRAKTLNSDPIVDELQLSSPPLTIPFEDNPSHHGSISGHSNKHSLTTPRKQKAMLLRVFYDPEKIGFEEEKEFKSSPGTIVGGRYRVLKPLGSAAFSKAVRAHDQNMNRDVCLKIIKNDKDYMDQSLDEIRTLLLLKDAAEDKKGGSFQSCASTDMEGSSSELDKLRVLDILDFFYEKEHLILVTELLKKNLYEYQRHISYKIRVLQDNQDNHNQVDADLMMHDELGVISPTVVTSHSTPVKDRSPVHAHGQKSQPVKSSMPALDMKLGYFTTARVHSIAKQICEALQFAHAQNLIHADLKPENILFESYKDCKIKVIDFGSSCFVTDRLSLYLQSRCYRAPEVILGLPYGQAIDVWSIGCVLAELWTGYVLFQNDEVNQICGLLARVNGIIGPFPEWMLEQGKNTRNFFTENNEIYKVISYQGDHQPSTSGSTRSSSHVPVFGRSVESPKGGRLLSIFVPKKTSLYQRLRSSDSDFVDFISQCLQIDPRLRPTCAQLLQHPWLLKNYQ